MYVCNNEYVLILVLSYFYVDQIYSLQHIK